MSAKGGRASSSAESVGSLKSDERVVVDDLQSVHSSSRKSERSLSSPGAVLDFKKMMSSVHATTRSAMALGAMTKKDKDVAPPSQAEEDEKPEQKMKHMPTLLVTAAHLEEVKESCAALVEKRAAEVYEQGRQEMLREIEALTAAQTKAVSMALLALEKKLGYRVDELAMKTEEAEQAVSSSVKDLADLRLAVRSEFDGAASKAAEAGEALTSTMARVEAQVEANSQVIEKQSKALAAMRSQAAEENNKILSDAEELRLTATTSAQLVHDALKKEVHDMNARQQSIIDHDFVGLRSAMADVERKLGIMEDATVELKKDMKEVGSVPVRRVDFCVEKVAELMTGGPDRRWTSPTFGVAGLPDFHLELKALQGDAAGDCRLSLRGRSGAQVMLRLYLGTCSNEFRHVFDSSPCVMHGWWKDVIDQKTGSLTVGMEVLESYFVDHGLPAALKDIDFRVDGASPEALAGKVSSYRHVFPSVLDRMGVMEGQLECLRSRVVGRVEWRLEQATMLQQSFARGECLCSAAFTAGGYSDLQLVFYPSGDKDARDLYCSFYLHAPGLETMQCWLSVGKHRREAQAIRDRPGLFGRSNFCLFEGTVHRAADALLLSLEIAEAQIVAPTSRAVPWPALANRGSCASPLQSDAHAVDAESALGYKEVVRNFSRLQGVPGRMAMEDVKLLPSIWTADLGTQGKGGALAKSGLVTRDVPSGLPAGFKPLADLPPPTAAAASPEGNAAVAASCPSSPRAAPRRPPGSPPRSPGAAPKHVRRGEMASVGGIKRPIRAAVSK